MNKRLIAVLAPLAAVLALQACSSSDGGTTTGGKGCPTGTTDCDGTCVVTDLDPNNCGACGTVCATDEVCGAGACGTSCPSGTAACSGSCVDTANNPLHCGTCGTTCATGEVCSNGQCASSCGGGTTKCGELCVDTNFDPSNCGSCDTACDAGEVCSAGSCGLECVGGSTKCGDLCVNTDLDPAHCGQCDTACAMGEVCSAGSCGVECLGGATKCGSNCVDTQNDPANCGTCSNACALGEVCSGGGCSLQCSGGTTKCGSTCVDTNTDPANCGTCSNACLAGQVCATGTCALQCPAGQTDCSGTCTDTNIDPTNCGTCSNACAANEACVTGICVALEIPPVSCLQILNDGDSTGNGTYSIDPDGIGGNAAYTVYCDMTTDGGGWTLVAKVDGANSNEGWEWNTSDWKSGSGFGGACVHDTSTACDGKSDAWGDLVVAQMMVNTGFASAYYNMVNTTRTMEQQYNLAGYDFTLPSNGQVIANRYGGSADSNYQVVSMGDGDGETISASSADRCMLHVRKNTSHTTTTGFCAGRTRSGTGTSFVFAPTSNSSNSRSDYARMNNGSSPTLSAMMLIFVR